MIVVDTSVWIAHLRNHVSPKVERLRAAFDQERLVVGDLVLMEVLQGMGRETSAATMESWFRKFEVLPMLDPASAARAATNYRQLRRHGITVRKTADMIIGTFCIDRGWPLLHDDRDFGGMERHLGLPVVHA